MTSGDEDQILSILKLFSSEASSMNDWLILHNYLVTAFSKLGTQTESLSKYAADIYEPFKAGGWDQFPKWYKSCVNKIDHFQFITDAGGHNALDSMMQMHLEKNLLGDQFLENTIVKVPVSHVDLVKPEDVLRYTNEIMKLVVTK